MEEALRALEQREGLVLERSLGGGGRGEHAFEFLRRRPLRGFAHRFPLWFGWLAPL
jgi:hypothetical protein